MGFYRKEESDMLTALLTIAFLEAVAGMAAVFLDKRICPNQNPGLDGEIRES